ncbi:hypothetical protein QJ043_07085 [Olsenella sp. YH-ols2217]|uniref:Uncharacterized protein n=1 Tax=Kribbibacterium absianum TaxID=3044210 RepID=A0ABT6ZMV7_9ACTN|nr:MULTISPECIES: hypothetical protein [unclassified Olsenella]MDJ1121830.1 hypothetical protein [Olsenella sp. YH-ols2216]MDJ1129838.1 hypothetical protein [Olsenella sp. YH-ols2217]
MDEQTAAPFAEIEEALREIWRERREARRPPVRLSTLPTLKECLQEVGAEPVGEAHSRSFGDAAFGERVKVSVASMLEVEPVRQARKAFVPMRCMGVDTLSADVLRYSVLSMLVDVDKADEAAYLADDPAEEDYTLTDGLYSEGYEDVPWPVLLGTPVAGWDALSPTERAMFLSDALIEMTLWRDTAEEHARALEELKDAEPASWDELMRERGWDRPRCAPVEEPAPSPADGWGPKGDLRQRTEPLAGTIDKGLKREYLELVASLREG